MEPTEYEAGVLIVHCDIWFFSSDTKVKPSQQFFMPNFHYVFLFSGMVITVCQLVF
jgi:hypothetical protein